jgi:hypothetical protein
MARPRSFSFALIALLVVAMLPLASCGSSPEQELLQKYFQASRMRDNQTLSNFATVSFSPSQEGIVQKFTVTSVGEEQRRPLRLKELAAAEAEVKKGEEEFSKKKKEYQDANGEAIQRVLKVEASGKGGLKGKDAEIQAEWTKWRDETKVWAGKLSDARKAAGEDLPVAQTSAYDARSQVDATQYEGEIVTKDVKFDAEVKSPEGQVASKKMHAVLTRVELKNGPAAKPTITGRWVITQLGEEGAAKK